MKIEWDPKKANLNLKKHGVAFEEAATALSDPMAVTGADPDHSEEGEAIRIISARKAIKGERKLYEEG